MLKQAQLPNYTGDARDWTPILRRYQESDHGRAVPEVLITAVPFALLWILMWASLGLSYWLTLIIAVPAAGFLVRLFMIQHDCGHAAFFRRRWANNWLGRAIGLVTLTPYDHWRRSHATHHASSGNLERRGIGDIDTLTVREYLRCPGGGGSAIVFHHPIVMFGMAPAFLFLVQHRLPIGEMGSGWRPRLTTMGTNAGIALLVATTMWFVGVGPFLRVHLPITLLAASIGVWLFYVQHQFEDTFWAKGSSWSLHEAALYGSSHYDLPIVIRWFTANIGIHRVHHLCSRIPTIGCRACCATIPSSSAMLAVSGSCRILDACGSRFGMKRRSD